MGSTKLFLRPNPLPPTIFSSTTHFVFPKAKSPIALSLFCTTTSTNQSLPYGPSLLKGITPQQQQHEENQTPVFNESQFIRIFHVAALRVPAKDCFALESRLRGHLLNWPRVRNIARVPGDEVDSRFLNLLADEEDESVESEELNSVLYRDNLARSFNVRGFVKFRNLARISRPKRRRRRRKEEEEEEEERSGGKEEKIYAVEVVEEVEGEEEMRRLLGEEFRGGEKWMGSTRLLLLDEKLVDKDVKDFPQAIKVSL